MVTVELIDYHMMPDVAWTKLSHAANDPSQSLRLMTVATVDNQGKPSNRTLVLRGADRASGLIWFHTDRRSPKIQHLKAQPHVSALAYDQNDCVQIRLDGPATLHQNDALAQRHWEQASLAVRYAYALPQGPGKPVQHADPKFQSMHSAQQHGHVEEGRQNFVVIQVQVEMIDWLQVASTGQRRALLRVDTGWKAQPLTP